MVNAFWPGMEGEMLVFKVSNSPGLFLGLSLGFLVSDHVQSPWYRKDFSHSEN